VKKLLYILILIGIIPVQNDNAVYSQTITIGSGLATNDYFEASPINISRDRSVSWTVYTAAELNAAGITGPSTINRMGFFVTNIPLNTIPNYTIGMKHTTDVNAGQNPGNNGYTQVVDPFSYTPAQGDWDMLNLDTPFNWNGVDNIAIKICWSDMNRDVSGQVRVIPTTNGYRYRWNNGNGSACGLNPNTNKQYKPQIRFVFDTETVWTGAVSTSWFNTGNWTAGIPDATIDTRIPTGTPNNPNLTGTGETANFTLQGSMTIQSSGEINVNGDFINSGTYTDNGGITRLTGTGPNAINNSVALDISNLIIDSKFGGSISGSMVTITEELQVNKSSLNTNDLITLRSDANGTARISELTTNCFFQLDMMDSWGDGWNGGYITILEDGIPVGVYQGFGAMNTEIIPINNGSTLQLQYTDGTWDSENSYDFYDPFGSLLISDGPSPTNGIVFTTTATCGFTDPISGQISMERYIDAGETYWRYMGSAVQGADIAQFNDDFITAGYPGSHFPNFGWVSAYNYDETLGAGLGYLECTGATQVMGVGEGWQIWCGDTITGTQPFTFDLKGVPNQGDINIPVTYTNTGTPAEDGFNMVSNPYPSTIDWDDADWTKTNMANATYIQNPDNQQYATYVAGASTNGGSRYIASQQSFWVQSTGASPALTAREGVKSSVDQGFFKSGNLSPGMTISLQGNGEFDEAVMRHIAGAVDEFEYAYDANKWWGGWGEYPQLSLINLNEGKDLTVHSFDTDFQEWSIPLRAVVFQNGIYNIVFNNLGEVDVPCMHLEDTYTGDMFLIEEGSSFSFEMSDTTYSPRFIIHLGKNYDITTYSASCNSFDDGAIELDLENTTAIDYELIKDGISTYGNDFGNPLQISNLESGIYSIVVPSLVNLCDQTSFNVVVSEPSPLIANENIQEETFGTDGSISVQITGGTPPYDYLWNTGDINNSVTNLSAGTYDMLVIDANGCELEESYDVNSILGIDDPSENISFIYMPTDNIIRINGWIGADNNQMNLYGVDGRLMQQFILYTEVEVQQLNLKDLAPGVYVLSNNKGLSFKFKK